MPLITSLHLDIEPLTTPLWLCPSSQFLIHLVHPSMLLQFGDQDEKVHHTSKSSFTVVRSFSVRNLLHLNAVTEEAGRQVPAATILQLLALFQLLVLW